MSTNAEQPERRPVAPEDVFDPKRFTKPHPSLRTYYIVTLAIFPPVLIFGLIPALLKYHSLRYRFDDEGVQMSWGVLFKREVSLGYRRIQDIHVTRGLIQRWFGLATVSVQTASASAMPEMKIEGIRDPEGLRDFLYARMRGATGKGGSSAVGGSTGDATSSETAMHDDASAEALALLHDIRDALRARVNGPSDSSSDSGATS